MPLRLHESVVLFWRSVFNTYTERRGRALDSRAKEDIAALFNKHYTYDAVYPFVPLHPDLRNRHAWMCPVCNKIHGACGISPMDGLHYPACCIYPKGNRLYIRS